MNSLAPGAALSLHFVGAWRSAAAAMEIRNPYTGDVIGRVACATPDDARAAVQSAAAGLEEIAAMSTAARAAMLDRAANLLAARREDFAQMITAEIGKPIRSADREVARAINTLRLSAEETVRLNGETIAFDSFPGGEGRSGCYKYEPVGVIIAITPFNDPLNLICHKIGPALAAGNSVVVKPAEQAPLTAVMLVTLLLEAGAPRRAVNLLTGYGADFGAVLTSHPDVALISFTGGAKVGDAICRNAGIKRIAMELGANGPVIVAQDADLEKAALSCVAGAFSAAGQNCVSVQRIFIHESVYAAFRRRFIEETNRLRVGDPSSPETDVGPMIEEAQAERIVQWTREAERQGATVLAGGTRRGALMQPTVLENLAVDARLFCDEAFGPVVGLFRFTDLDQAIERANAAEYAIHAAIFTESLRTAERAIKRLKAAGVMVNDSTDYRLDAMPFGGYGRGNMGREGVRFAIREMSQTKVVCYHAA